jgi:formylglycine-generating enzyme required for sulfatase activity
MRSLMLLCVLPLTAAAAVDFSTGVKPVMEKYCLSCHNPQRAYADVRVDAKDALFAGKSVVPGNPGASTLYTTMKAGTMPPAGPKPSAAEIETIRQWIAEGAPWPDGVRIGAAPPTMADDRKLVTALGRKIVVATKERRPADMKPYRATIPGTDVAFRMTPVPGGEFTMGDPNASGAEKPAHRVRVDPFWMGVHEVTWDEYRLFMFATRDGSPPEADAISTPTRPYVEMSFGMGLNGYPAISMTQHAANKYAQWLSAKTGHFYRLPTEAEWEFACKAGGAALPPLNEAAWHADNSGEKYQQVGKKKPNAFGLHDMLGNVMEWTLDQFDPHAYAARGSELIVNPWVKSTSPYPHAVRGGGWADPPEACTCTARLGSDPSWKVQDPQLPKSIWYHTDAQWLGFRLVRPLRIPSSDEMDAAWNNGVAEDP